RGASTLSQQTAKNLFLWDGRSWVRKGLEAGLTLGIETVWSKKWGGPRLYQKPAVTREGRVHHRELMCRIYDGKEEVSSAEYMPMV
ncbi:transglycosylase domain-containing protein, partial [Salmonella enterica subsp. enterica serovar Anatum]|nr:transglycosylase domain-containing protein [Salmonella enterica subsp. enterica serovar Anatum]